MQSLDIYASTQCPRNGLNVPMDQNVHTLNQIRSIYQKCDMIRKDTPVSNIFHDCGGTQLTSPPKTDQSRVYKNPSFRCTTLTNKQPTHHH
jgi:hypothetical protein